MFIADHNQARAGFVVRLFSAFGLALAAMTLPGKSWSLDTGDIVVASTRGEVHFVVRGVETKLRAGSVLQLPASVRTGSTGSVELRQGATSVSVGPDTLLEFPALEKAGGPIDRIIQPRGNAFYDIGKRQGRKLRVETPLLVGVVKGTQFNVAAGDDSGTISLVEGLLEIHAADESSVVDLKAGEIASRRRGDKAITVIRMEGDKAPPTQRPSPGSGGTGGNTEAPAAPSPAGLPSDDGDSYLAGGDAPGVSVELPDVADGGARADVAIGPGVVDANADVGASVEVGPVAADVAVNTDAEIGGGAASVDVDTSAGVDLGSGVAAVGADVAAGVDVGTGGVAVDTAVDVDVDVGGGAATVDTGIGAGLDVGGGAASVDLDTSANVDLGGGAAAVGADVGAGVDVGTGGVAVDTAVDVDVDVGGGAATVDTGIGAGLDVGGGAASVDVGASNTVDLGGTTTVDVDVNAGADVGAGNANVDVGADVAGVDTGVTAGVDLGSGNVDLGVDLGGVDLDVGLDLGLDDEAGQGEDAGNTDTGTPASTPETPDTGGMLDGLLDGLFRRPGSK